MNKKTGFILIELMLVLFLIIVLTTISIPDYSSYIMRAKLAEVFNMVSPIKQAVADYYAYHGIMPKNNQALALTNAELQRGKYVSTMSVENGAIHVTVNIKPNPPIIISVRPVILKPELNNNIPLDYVSWLYGNCPLADTNKMQVLGTNKTSLTEKEKYWISCN